MAMPRATGDPLRCTNEGTTNDRNPEFVARCVRWMVLVGKYPRGAPRGAAK
jgi:hypothetical protein